MNKITLEQWVEITRESGMPLYAVLTKTGASQAVAEYYRHDGSHTPYGLYARTPYADWFSVMPMIVSLSENSSFLSWAAETEHKDWGWLARSPFSLDVIGEHIRGLTQVILPSGKEVFFRYWDGEYFSEHLRFFGQDWADILPSFPFYWVNGEYFTVQIPAQSKPQSFPWWHVPQQLIDFMLEENLAPLVTNLIIWLQENEPDLYESFPETTIRYKAEHLCQLSQAQSMGKSLLMEKLVNALKDDLALQSNPFETLPLSFFTPPSF